MRHYRLLLFLVLIVTLMAFGAVTETHAVKKGIPVTVINTPLPVVGIGNGGGEEVEVVSEFWNSLLPTDPPFAELPWMAVPDGKKLIVTDLLFQRPGGPAGTQFIILLYGNGISKFEYEFGMDSMLNSFELHLKSGIVFAAGTNVSFSIILSGDPGMPPMPPMDGETVRVFASGYLTNQ